MKKIPEQYALPDIANHNFIDVAELQSFLEQENNTQSVDEVVSIALAKQRLTLEQVAVLLNADIGQREKVLLAAEKLKQEVYGNRIVLFAPLYVGNYCSNCCTYCDFRADNTKANRKTLTSNELKLEVEALMDVGHKRLILVFGEHHLYSADFIAKTVRETYSVKKNNGEIRRVNINAAPLSVEDFRTVKESGIGTYQVFQETYDPLIYAKYHKSGKKSDYLYRLTAFDRAMQAGVDDVGIGVLFGLGDWKMEVMGLVRHTVHLEDCFNVGPHTISFPRITQTLGAENAPNPISDDDFIYAIAVLRLAVPYAGLILTARENPVLRDNVIRYGVSQIDGGSQLDIGSYANAENAGTKQFKLNDDRSLHEIMDSLIDNGRLPSFCTACYRKGRTGEHFMEFSVPGFIKRFCTPNAIITLAEYLEDYASHETKISGYQLIDKELEQLNSRKDELEKRLNRIKAGERDILY